MFRRLTTRMGILALAGLGLFQVAEPANAQQGWPIAGANWGTTGGGGGRGGYGWSRSYYPSYSSSYPPSFGSYSGSHSVVNPSSSGAYYSYYSGPTSVAESSKKRSAVINLGLPSDAKVWFDQTQTKQTGALRSFESPPLDVGSEYVYQIRIEMKRDNKEVTETRRVTVRAGDVINLSLGSPTAVAAAR